MKKSLIMGTLIFIMLLSMLSSTALSGPLITTLQFEYDAVGNRVYVVRMPKENTIKVSTILNGTAIFFIPDVGDEVVIMLQGLDLALTREEGDTFNVKGSSIIILNWNAGPRDARGQSGPYEEEFRGTVKGEGIFTDGFDDGAMLRFVGASYSGQMKINMTITKTSGSIAVAGEGTLRYNP